MSLRELLSEEGRRLAAETVRAVESQTSAEIVLAVRPRSSTYREADYLLGFACSLATLLALLYLPQPFGLDWFAVDVTAAFLAGSLLGMLFPGLRRWLVSQRAASQAVSRAAKAAFVDLGVSRTKGRTGVLVYVSAYERRVEVVVDVGVHVVEPSASWQRALADLRAVARGGVDRDRLLAAVRRLGPPLGAGLPRAEDDENELPDAPSTHEESWP